MVLYKKKYTSPQAEIEEFSITDAIHTSPGQGSGENPPIIINHGKGNVEMYVETPEEVEEGIEY
ncbi:MAG: hypothetical protein IJT65_07190 [Eubacterium sp.]|nr:hypothetical protein [Eubacterium sp.]